MKKILFLLSAFVFVTAFTAEAQGKEISCKKALSLGYTCNITKNADGTTNKEVCKTIRGIVSDPSDKKLCTNTLFNKNGVKQSQTVCDSTDSTGKCRVKRERFYNANGQLVSDRSCSSAYRGTNQEGSYTAGVEYAYKGKDLVSLKSCKQYDAAGKCSGYDSSFAKTFDDKHKVLKTRKCLLYSSKEDCRNPSGSENVYDDKGKLLYSKKCYVYEGDKCRSYGPSIFYTYDEKNNIISERDCQKYDENNVCTQYRSSGFEYTYDNRNNRVTAVRCSYNKEGKCRSTGGLTEFIYDEDNVLIAEKFCRDNNLNADTGKCDKYDTSYYNALFL